MIERISRRPAPSLRSAAVVTGRCRLKVEKKARNASSSLPCDDSAMSQDRLRFTSAYIIRLIVAGVLLHRLQLSNLVVLILLQLAQIFCYTVNNLSQLAPILQCFHSPGRVPEYVNCIYSSCLFVTVIGADKDLGSRMVNWDVRRRNRNVSLTCKLVTDWNRTNLSSIGRPSLTTSSGTSSFCATSVPPSSPTSLKSIAGRLTSSEIDLGPFCDSAVCRTTLLILTA